MTSPKLAVVSAGLGQPSSTRMLADRLAEAAVRRIAATSEDAPDAPDAPDTTEAGGPAVEIVELRGLASQIADATVTGFPGPALRGAQETVADADGLIVVTPVFNASYSGLFKSFFDVLEPGTLALKPVLLAATGGTPRHSLVLEHAMRPLFAYLRAVPVPTAVYAASEDWGGGGAGDDGLVARIERAAGELGDLMGALPRRPRGDEELVPFEEQLAALRSG